MNYRTFPYHYPEPTEFFINISGRKCELYRCDNLAKDCHILCAEHLLWLVEQKIIHIFEKYESSEITEEMISNIISEYEAWSNIKITVHVPAIEITITSPQSG